MNADEYITMRQREKAVLAQLTRRHFRAQARTLGLRWIGVAAVLLAALVAFFTLYAAEFP